MAGGFAHRHFDIAARRRFAQIGTPAADFADPPVGFAPVLQRLVAPALIRFERGSEDLLGGGGSAACAGTHAVQVHAANPKSRACARGAARYKETFNMTNLTSHATNPPRSESE